MKLDVGGLSERERAWSLIITLAPFTRRDYWWDTDGIVDLVLEHLAAERALCARALKDEG